MAEILKVVIGSVGHLLFVITVDSHGPNSSVSTLPEGTDYRLRHTVARTTEPLEIEEIATMQWIDGKPDLTDTLTKGNLDTCRRMNEVLMSGAPDPCMFERTKRIQFN